MEKDLDDLRNQIRGQTSKKPLLVMTSVGTDAPAAGEMK